MEKRNHKRHACEASLECSYFHHTPEQAHPARMLNYSETGVYLETEGFFRSGATVLLRLERFMSETSGEEVWTSPRIVALGQVKWCKEKTDGDPRYFAMGVGYLGGAD